MTAPDRHWCGSGPCSGERERHPEMRCGARWELGGRVHVCDRRLGHRDSYGPDGHAVHADDGSLAATWGPDPTPLVPPPPPLDLWAEPAAPVAPWAARFLSPYWSALGSAFLFGLAVGIAFASC